jgi:hypothetical protein
MKVKEFIQSVLVKEIKDIQQEEGHHYLSFGLIAQGIEFLGACIDNHEFFVEGQSRNRFEKAIRDLFPADYHGYLSGKGNPFDLYENLRCGLLHVILPNADVELIQENEIKKFGDHLEIAQIRKRKRLILVSQRLFSDFENACGEVTERIDKGTISHNKVYDEFMGTEP